jgi:GTP 3',8-cyclase
VSGNARGPVFPDHEFVANGRLRLFLTSDCNLACFYCHNEGQPKGTSYLSRHMAVKIRDVVKAGGVRKIIFSGGEPLIHPEVLDYVEMLSPHVGRASLITNGLLLNRKRAFSLRQAGLSKIRLGVDSFREDKPRPSVGYLSTRFSVRRTVDDLREAGLRVDLNVVLTKFNQNEIAKFLSFAIEQDLNIKFFEHLEVAPPPAGSMVNRMRPVPQVGEAYFLDVLRATLGHLPEFHTTDQFAPATMAATVRGTEIRYCRYLCTYGRCFAPGTRLDPEGYVYTCMSNRGMDRISVGTDSAGIVAALARASRRPCAVDESLVKNSLKEL